MERKYTFKLFISGHTPSSERAVANLRKICRRNLSERYSVSIIDVLEYPQLAEDEKILATPTLIKELPPPCRRIVGDLSDEETLLQKLDF